MKEEFKELGKYTISSLGIIRRTRDWKELATVVTKKGYITVSLSIDKKRKPYSVHRLVATAFISNCLSKGQVNHINGKKSDNRLENLEWVTSKENMQHAFRTGLVSVRSSHESNTASLDEFQVLAMATLIPLTRRGLVCKLPFNRKSIENFIHSNTYAEIPRLEKKDISNEKTLYPDYFNDHKYDLSPLKIGKSCKNGHFYSANSTMFTKKGSRMCKICFKAANRRKTLVRQIRRDIEMIMELQNGEE